MWWAIASLDGAKKARMVDRMHSAWCRWASEFQTEGRNVVQGLGRWVWGKKERDLLSTFFCRCSIGSPAASDMGEAAAARSLGRVGDEVHMGEIGVCDRCTWEIEIDLVHGNVGLLDPCLTQSVRFDLATAAGRNPTPSKKRVRVMARKYTNPTLPQSIEFQRQYSQ